MEHIRRGATKIVSLLTSTPEENADRILRRLKNQYQREDSKARKFMEKIRKKGLAAFEFHNYESLLEFYFLTEEERDKVFLMYIRERAEEKLPEGYSSFNIKTIILENGALGKISAFTDLLTLQSYLRTYGFPQEKTDAIISKLYQEYIKNPIIQSIGFTLLKGIDDLLEGSIIRVQLSNDNKPLPCRHSKSIKEWNTLFHAYGTKNYGSLSGKDGVCILDTIFDFFDAIHPDNLMYHKSLFIPFVEYLANHPNIPTRTLAQMMYELAYGCIKDGEPEIVLFLQQHLNQKGKFKNTTTYEEASNVLEPLLLPKELFDFMLSSLEKKKIVGLSSKPTIPFTYVREEVVEEVEEEEGLFTQEERKIFDYIYELPSSNNGADNALIASLCDMSISGAFAMLDDIGRGDLKEAFLIYQGKNLIVDFHALEELYMESSDESLIEEKDSMMERLKEIHNELEKIKVQKEEEKLEKTKELYYFTRLVGDDCLSDMNHLDKQHKKNLAILLGKLQSRKVFGYSINSNCYFLGGDDIVLYYTILPNGMYCILRIFPGEQLNTSREFLKNATFWEELNALKAACEKQDTSWEYYAKEGEKAKQSIEELKCSPVMEKTK